MYADLQGAFGREAHYRPPRFRPKDLVSPHAQVRLRVNGTEYPVIDISSTGAAILLRVEASSPLSAVEERWPLNAPVDAEFVLHGRPVQRVSARAVRTEPGPRGVRVGLAFEGGFLDLEAAKRLDARFCLDQALSAGPRRGHASVPTQFREAVGEAVYLAQYFKRCLDPHEADARAKGEQAVCDLAAEAYASLAPAYADLRERASRAAEQFMTEPSVLRAAKAYTETVLTPLLLASPMPERSYRKPLGYPGDYQVMLYYYANAYEGPTAFAKLFHKLFVEHPLSAGVCTRKEFVVKCMHEALARHHSLTPGADFAVTSLGCGPAMEVASFVDARRSWEGRVRWRLIDQEPRTLQVAYEGALRALCRAGGRTTVECLNLSFGQLLKQPQLFTRGGRQDFIYSTGLFDYLPKQTAQALLVALYSCLTPGGELLVGNAVGPNHYFFCPEFVLDWNLTYRTKQEMFDLAACLPSTAEVEVELEPGAAYWFLRVRKAH
ncbi:MAG TPA: PilZ domain-containing protein [Polyangiaceae bacterium]|nr:PilZ domain-containing protein [Polyangiaceae bacterium]